MQKIHTRGFTLIEVLVVVLIIAVLGAIALPQYQKAVRKSNFTALMPIGKTLANSNEAYYLEHGEYADNAQDLPVNGQVSYPNGTQVELVSDSDYSYTLVYNDDKLPDNNYLAFQKHSVKFADTTMCEARDEAAAEICKALGGTDLGGGVTANWTAYLLSGDATGSNFCPTGATCDSQGQITECDSGLTLNNGECVTCDIPNATSCSTTSYAPTACSEGYIVNGTACEPDPTVAQLQAVAAAKCPANQTQYVCTIKNGAVSRCDTDSGTINEQGECVNNGTQGYYEEVFNPDGTQKQAYGCIGVDSGHCYKGQVADFATGTGKRRQCADNAAISKDATCANGYANSGFDYTYDSHGGPRDTNTCSAVNEQGVCTAYSRMLYFDRTYDANGNETGRTQHTCTSISGTECLTWNPPL